MIRRKNRIYWTIAAILIAVLLNGLFSYINDTLLFPIFMDSIFTVMTAALFGLWPAVFVGLFTNFFLEVIHGFPAIYYPFAIINVVTALVTSFFVYKKFFETPAHAFWLIIVLSLVNSILGAIIVTIVFSGFTNLSMDNIVRGITLTGQSVFSAAFIVRIITNIVDKGIAVVITFSIYKWVQTKISKKV